MALVRKLSRYPGGRSLIFITPLICIVSACFLFEPNDMTQIGNLATLFLSLCLAVTYRKSIIIFAKDYSNVGNVWFGVGIFTLVCATAALRAYTFYLRASGMSLDTTYSRFVSIISFIYPFSFGCLYVARFAQGTEVPPTGWISLLLIVSLSTIVGLFGIWWF